jgi:transposase-like protein
MNMIKEMHAAGPEGWSDDYHEFGRRTIAEFLHHRMRESVADHLGRLADETEDRRNGSYVRHVLTELGDILVSVPRTRRYIPSHVLTAYARRSKEVDRLILACFLLGLSTRKVGTALCTILGEKVSPQTVSRVSRTLDEAVAAFHQRALSNGYRALVFDGIILSRKTGMGPLRRPVLVVLGIRPDGKKEVIDFHLATSESGPAWEHFLTDLAKRGLTGTGVEVISVDGGPGLLSVLPDCYPGIPVQRCWAHKMRNILDKVKKKDHDAVQKGLQKIYEAPHGMLARQHAGRWRKRWEGLYPAAVRCLSTDLEDLLTCFQFTDPVFRKAVRTTNHIERRFKEVRRRTRPMGVFSNKTSVDRILYAVFMYENKTEEVYPVFAVTHKC